MTCQKLSGEVEIDTQYKSINLKGTHPQNMHRYSKKRGKQAAYRGLLHHKDVIVCATDENDHMMLRVSGLGSELFDKCKANKEYFEVHIRFKAKHTAVCQLSWSSKK